MASERTIARLQAQIHRRAAHCLQFEVADPRSAFVTITGVELSKDLQHAKIHYSVLGDESEVSRTEHMLEHARGFVQRQVAGTLQLRRAPRLSFHYDDSIAEAARMDRVIREARERDRAIRPEREQEDEAPPPDPVGGGPAA